MTCVVHYEEVFWAAIAPQKASDLVESTEVRVLVWDLVVLNIGPVAILKNRSQSTDLLGGELDICFFPRE